MAVAPRHYGLGPYGLQRYGTYPAALWAVAGATQISFSLGAAANRVLAAAGATQISFIPAALPTRIIQPMAATQISFSLWARPNCILTFFAATQISFSLQGALVKTWQQVGPCETGTWQQDLPPWTERQAA